MEAFSLKVGKKKEKGLGTALLAKLHQLIEAHGQPMQQVSM